MGKKQVEEAAPDLNVVMNTTLNLLLLTFFIYLNTIATVDDSRERVALGSLLGTFGILPGGISSNDGTVLLPADPPMINIDELDPDSDDSTRRLKEYLVDTGIKSAVSIEYKYDELSEKQAIFLGFSSDIMFSSGDVVVTPQFKRLLNKVGWLVIKNDYSLRIEGHTDNIKPAHGSNWRVSTQRAVSVLRYLSENYYIDPSSISAVGFAEYRPEVSNRTRAGRAKNRRVEIVLMEKFL